MKDSSPPIGPANGPGQLPPPVVEPDIRLGDLVRERFPRGGQCQQGEVVEVSRPDGKREECYSYAFVAMPALGLERVRCSFGDLIVVGRKAEKVAA